MRGLHIVIITIFFGACFLISLTTLVHNPCPGDVRCEHQYQAEGYSSPIVISRDSFSPSSKVEILIHAPDFNSNSYAIDTIGRDGSEVVISTRESRIPYILVETGPDTGDFAGYLILSSTTSTCSPVCGPSDGFLAAGGDDAITVSFTYEQGHTITSTSYAPVPSKINEKTIPEFPFVELTLLSSIVFLIFYSKTNLTR